ncbi:MAG: DUF4123 domain-containing protein [Dechloromonas sp.]|nr:DUF4123 domain-containing protein [Dechloromonas sp.]
MYFAVNPCRPDLAEQMLSTLGQLREQHPAAPIHCYLLVDASFDQALIDTFPWRRAVECSLYDGMRLEGLREVAPHLVQLPDEPKNQCPWLQQLIDACGGKPMLSMLISAIPAERLRDHFKPYLLARSEDSLEWPVRWADTRTLPGLIGALTDEELRHLFSPLYAWIAVGRQGELIHWQGEGNPHPEAAGFDCWPLDETRFGELLAEAEADAVLSQIDDRRPDLLARDKPADIHARVARQLAIASRHKVSAAPHRLHFAMLGLIYRPTFVDDSLMCAMLAKVEQGSDYQEEIRQLPRTFWMQHEQGKPQ